MTGEEKKRQRKLKKAIKKKIRRQTALEETLTLSLKARETLILDTLADNTELCTSIFDFYLQKPRLQYNQEVFKIFPMSATPYNTEHTYVQRTPTNYFKSHKTLLFPCLENGHFCLFVYDVETHKLRLYDSNYPDKTSQSTPVSLLCQPTNTSTTNARFDHLVDWITKQWHYWYGRELSFLLDCQVMECQQEIGPNCGIHVLWNITEILKGNSPIPPVNVNEFRQKLRDIFHGKHTMQTTTVLLCRLYSLFLFSTPNLRTLVMKYPSLQQLKLLKQYHSYQHKQLVYK
jgi:hypothetical protein